MSDDGDGGKIVADVNAKTAQASRLQEAAENDAKAKGNVFTTTGIGEGDNGNVVLQGYYSERIDENTTKREHQTWYENNNGKIKHHTFHNGNIFSDKNPDERDEELTKASLTNTSEHNGDDYLSNLKGGEAKAINPESGHRYNRGSPKDNSLGQ